MAKFVHSEGFFTDVWTMYVCMHVQSHMYVQFSCSFLLCSFSSWCVNFVTPWSSTLHNLARTAQCEGSREKIGYCAVKHAWWHSLLERLHPGPLIVAPATETSGNIQLRLHCGQKVVRKMRFGGFCSDAPAQLTVIGSRLRPSL